MNQFFSNRTTLVALAFSGLLVCAGRTHATEISGTISATLTIYDDSELVGDVTCAVPAVPGGPCIQFGASGIKLRLKGHTITENTPGCTPDTSSNDGIDVVGVHDVAILGPGLIQKFGGFGIGIEGASKVKVEGVTTSDNCFSGIFLGGTTDSDIERNVSVRNSIGSEGAPCGGT
jgi:Right handed beta helix region